MVKPSFTVTLFQLSLAAADPETGQYPRQYTVRSIVAPIIARGSGIMVNGVGFYAKTDALALTDYAAQEGDIIEDAYSASTGNYWLVMARRPRLFGDVFILFELDLVRQLNLPFLVSGPEQTSKYVGYDPTCYDPACYEYVQLIAVPP